MTTEANWSLASQKPFKTLFGGSSAGLPSSSAASSSAPGASTSSGPQVKGTKTGAQAMVRAARSRCKNTMEFALRFLQDADARRMSSIITSICAPTDLWHSDQNKACRSPQEALEFHVAEAAGR
eukprot:9292741-Lingulodinium_polyedra.AAC.1